MVARIASFSLTNQLVETNLRVQAEYATTQIQISTGLKSENYHGIAAQANQILNLESAYSEVEAQIAGSQTALDRTEFMFSALGNMIDIGQSFFADLNAALTGLSVTPAQIQQSAQSTFDQFVGVLNSKMGDRYIFSGAAINTRPVDTTTYGGATPPSVADTSYYQGNNYIHSVEVSEGFTVAYGVTADDPSIEVIMRALDLVITSPADPNALQEAIQLFELGLDDVATLKASVAQDSNAIDRAINSNEAQLNLIDNMIVELKEVDLADASVRIQQLGTQLEAAYAVSTDLLELSLVNFLR